VLTSPGLKRGGTCGELL